MMKSSLPMDEFLPEIGRLLQSHSAVVVTAAPGAGKTTRLPPAALQWVSGKVLVLEPRRMAAIAAALRIAEENNWTAGQEVGWQVRFENKVTDSTRLVFLTEALLARKMISDPELKDVDLVILDEFHERSMHTDLTLGLLQELRQMGRDIKLIIMSATLAAQKISEYLDNAPIVDVPGKLYPLEVTYRKSPQRLRTDEEFYNGLMDTARTAIQERERDILIFLPGLGEIERARERLLPLAEKSGRKIQILHGSLPLEEQRSVLRGSSQPRLILSTNIAESSVTVDGVDTVIDSGLVKVSRFDLKTGFSRLELSRISKSSATQRAGRSARQYPGKVYRLWSTHDDLSMADDEVPEIQRADLSEGLLFLAHQGVRDFASFSWFESPSAALLQSAAQSLKALGALDASGALTPKGEKLLRYPLSPRLASLVVTSQEMDPSGGFLDLAARIAALLQEKDFLREDFVRDHLGDRLECDLTLRLQSMDRFRPPAIMAALQQLRRQLKVTHEKHDIRAEDVRKLVLMAFPDRLCRRRSKSDISGRGLMVGGRGVKLHPTSLVKESEFFIALQGAEGDGEAETLVRWACGLEKDFVLSSLKDSISRSSDLYFDKDKGKIYLREYRSFLGLPLDEPTLKTPDNDTLAEKMPDLLVERFDELLKKNEELSRWWARWNFLKRLRKIEWHWSSKEWRGLLAEASYGHNSLESVCAQDLAYYFEKSLPTELQSLMRELPSHCQVPSGNRLRIHYPTDKDPYLEVRLQEVFGWAQTPLLLKEVPLTLHLLGPNFRPVQVTSDLASFWKNAYPEVRKELRARYPKHSWPEDPLTAPAVSKGRPRSN